MVGYCVAFAIYTTSFRRLHSLPMYPMLLLGPGYLLLIELCDRVVRWAKILDATWLRTLICAASERPSDSPSILAGG